MPYYPPRPEGEPDKREKKNNPLAGRIRRGIVLCVCLSLVTYGLIRLAGYGADWLSSRRTAQELKEVLEESDPPETTAVPAASEAPVKDTAPETKATPSPLPSAESPVSSLLPAVEYPGGLKLNSRIQKLRKKSRYIIGWLAMDDLDEPVALKDNDFFLNHDAMGSRNANGAVFMDEGTNLMVRPYTILLYGHNMKTGAMFGNLRKYEDSAYCHMHRVFQFDTLYEEGQYAAFAVGTVSLTPGTGRYLNLEALQSRDRQTRKQELSRLISLSAHNVILDVREDDQLLLLITCVGNDDERLILAARRLRENETRDSLTLKSI